MKNKYKWTDEQKKKLIGRIPHNKGKKYEFKRRKTTITKECLFCKKEIILVPSFSRIKFCSSKCYWDSIKGVPLSPEKYKKIIKMLNEQKNNPVTKEKIRNGLLKKWSDKDYRDRMKKIHKDLWNNKSFREKHLKSTQSKEFRLRKSSDTTNYFLKGNFNYKGYFFSQKNNAMIGYRSRYELVAMRILEQMTPVLNYAYEKLSIPYIDDKGQQRKTIPDFIINYSDGSKEIVEVKPEFKIKGNLDNTKSKIEALEKYCKINGYKFSIWSEDKIFPSN